MRKELIEAATAHEKLYATLALDLLLLELENSIKGDEEDESC